jgi:hypothetical protein
MIRRGSPINARMSHPQIGISAKKVATPTGAFRYTEPGRLRCPAFSASKGRRILKPNDSQPDYFFSETLPAYTRKSHPVGSQTIKEAKQGAKRIREQSGQRHHDDQVDGFRQESREKKMAGGLLADRLCHE